MPTLSTLKRPTQRTNSNKRCRNLSNYIFQCKKDKNSNRNEQSESYTNTRGGPPNTKYLGGVMLVAWNLTTCGMSGYNPAQLTLLDQHRTHACLLLGIAVSNIMISNCECQLPVPLYRISLALMLIFQTLQLKPYSSSAVSMELHLNTTTQHAS